MGPMGPPGFAARPRPGGSHRDLGRRLVRPLGPLPGFPWGYLGSPGVHRERVRHTTWCVDAPWGPLGSLWVPRGPGGPLGPSLPISLKNMKFGPLFLAEIAQSSIEVHQIWDFSSVFHLNPWIPPIPRKRRGKLQLRTSLHTRARITYDGSRRN